MSPGAHPLAASVRLYRRLLLLYPASHRAEYGRLMSQLFEDQLRAAWRRGRRRALVELWGRALLDTASSVVLEHLDRWSEPMRNGSRLLLAAAAAILVVPVTFVVLNLLQYGLHLSIPWNPHDLLWPQVRFTVWRYLYDAVIVLSAPLALGLLMARLLQMRWRPQVDALAWVVIRKGDRIGLGLMALCLLLMATMGLYFIGENLPCILGQRLAC
jgi:hypothetical protein